MLVLGHLSIKLWVLITFAYGAQTRQTFMRWNPLSIAHEKSIQHPSINLIVIHTLRTRIFYLMMWTFGWSSETCTNMLGCLLGGGSSQEKFMKVGVEESNMLPSPNAIGGGGCEGPGLLEALPLAQFKSKVAIQPSVWGDVRRDFWARTVEILRLFPSPTSSMNDIVQFFPLSIQGRFFNCTLTSVLSHLWQPQCTWHYRVLRC
jgi:hypothetical protein